MIPRHIIEIYGTPRTDLEAYNCIFDELAGKYDASKPHKHRVINAWNINHPGFIWDGIAYEQEGNGIISGCKEKDFIIKEVINE